MHLHIDSVLLMRRRVFQLRDSAENFLLAVMLSLCEIMLCVSCVLGFCWLKTYRRDMCMKAVGLRDCRLLFFGVDRSAEMDARIVGE